MEDSSDTNNVISKSKLIEQLGVFSTLPEEILLNILYLAVIDIQNYEAVRKTSQMLNDFVSEKMTRKVVKISRISHSNAIVDTFTRYYDTIISVIIAFGTEVSKVKETLIFCESLGNLERLLIRGSTLQLDETISKLIHNVVIACPKINILKVTKVRMSQGNHNNDWRNIIASIGTRHLKKLTYQISCVDGYAVEKVCRTSRNTLQVLKVIIDTQHIPIRDIGNCLELKKLMLKVQWQSYDFKYSMKDLFQLEKLVQISITVDCVLHAELTEFFTRPCCGLIRKIELLIKTCKEEHTGILNAIATNCESLIKLNFLPSKLMNRNIPYFIPLQTVLNLLNRCRQLRYVILSPMMLDDVLEFDKIIHPRYNRIQYFCVFMTLTEDFLNEKCNPVREIYDANNEHNVTKCYELYMNAQMKSFNVRFVFEKNDLKCFIFYHCKCLKHARFPI